MLHEQPLAHGLSIIPISATYAHLVRKLLVIHDMQYFTVETSAAIWRLIIKTATQLCKLFPRLRTLRLVVEQDIDIGETWETLCGKDDAPRDE
jgi:hypothetical protein